MKLVQSDFLFAVLAHQASGILQGLGDWETRRLRRELEPIRIDRPIFLTGLARSGTTILLEQLARIPGVATHRYRDFPFLMTPVFWNRFVNRFAGNAPPVERPHKDRIQITVDSPEAFEEPIWQHFFPQVHSPTALHRLTAKTHNAEFVPFFRDHLRKILLLRQGVRYLSKENYNVARIEFLGRIFPDARFIVPIREPFTHVHSLVRQHALFCGYDQNDHRIHRYLAMAGHYEFGPQRCPIRLDAASGDRILSAWSQNRDYEGYAIQWNAIYRQIHELRSRGDELSRRILVVRYEDFCAAPLEVMRRILSHVELSDSDLSEADYAHISPPREGNSRPDGEPREEVARETQETAASYGYQTEKGVRNL